MPDEIDLGYAIGLPPERAITYFEERGKVLSPIHSWREIWREANARAFTVAQSARFNILGDIHEELAKALKEGKTEQQFIKNLETRLKAKGWWGRQEVLGPDGKLVKVQLGSPHRLKTIFRANMRSSYAAAHYEAAKRVADEFPIWIYDAVMDESTRPSHAALNDLAFRHDDPFWDSHYPPNGFNCRCMVRKMTEAEATEEGVQVTDGARHLEPAPERPGGIDKETGEIAQEQPMRFKMGQRVMTPDPGWSHNPGAVGLGPLQQLDIRKTQGRLLKAEKTGKAAAAKMKAIIEQSNKSHFRSEHYRSFIATTLLEHNNHWPLAVMSAARVKQLGLPKNARIVQISSQNVKNPSGNHQARWVKQPPHEWEYIQELVDKGAYQIDENGFVMIEDIVGGKPWRLVIKGTDGGEIYIKTFHRRSK